MSHEARGHREGLAYRPALSEAESKFFAFSLQFFAACEAPYRRQQRAPVRAQKWERPGFAALAVLYSHIANYQFGNSYMGLPETSRRGYCCSELASNPDAAVWAASYFTGS